MLAFATKQCLRTCAPPCRYVCCCLWVSLYSDVTLMLQLIAFYFFGRTSVDRLKAHLVAKGYSSSPRCNIDCLVVQSIVLPHQDHIPTPIREWCGTNMQLKPVQVEVLLEIPWVDPAGIWYFAGEIASPHPYEFLQQKATPELLEPALQQKLGHIEVLDKTACANNRSIISNSQENQACKKYPFQGLCLSKYMETIGSIYEDGIAFPAIK